jgi:hypothetical protein
MPSTATVTAKIGPAQSLTATVFNNVTSFNFDVVAKVLTVVANGITTMMDINAATTVTCTIATGNFTLTVS